MTDELPEKPTTGSRPETTMSRVVLGVATTAIAVVGIVAGLVVAQLTGGRPVEPVALPTATSSIPDASAGAGTTSPSSVTSTAAAASSSGAPTSTAGSSSTSTTAPRSTVTTSASTVSTSVVSPTASALPPPSLPPAINVSYSQDSAGVLVIPRGGSGVIQLTNTGGTAGQWTLSLSGIGYQLSQSSGEVPAGTTITVLVNETGGRDHNGTVNAVVAPGNRFTILLRTP